MDRLRARLCKLDVRLIIRGERELVFGKCIIINRHTYFNCNGWLWLGWADLKQGYARQAKSESQGFKIFFDPLHHIIIFQQQFLYWWQSVDLDFSTNTLYFTKLSCKCSVGINITFPKKKGINELWLGGTRDVKYGVATTIFEYVTGL